MPWQSCNVASHALEIGFVSTFPCLRYHLSSFLELLIALTLKFMLNSAPICAPWACIIEVLIVDIVSSSSFERNLSVDDVGSRGPKKYSAWSLGIPWGRDGRTTYFRACCNFPSLRFDTPRMDKILTLKESCRIISLMRSDGTDSPSSINVCTFSRILCFRSLLKMPLKGPP